MFCSHFYTKRSLHADYLFSLCPPPLFEKKKLEKGNATFLYFFHKIFIQNVSFAFRAREKRIKCSFVKAFFPFKLDFVSKQRDSFNLCQTFHSLGKTDLISDFRHLSKTKRKG